MFDLITGTAVKNFYITRSNSLILKLRENLSLRNDAGAETGPPCDLGLELDHSTSEPVSRTGTNRTEIHPLGGGQS